MRLKAEVKFTREAIQTSCGHHFDWRMGKTWKLTKTVGWILIISGIFSLHFENLIISALLIATGISSLTLRKFYLRRCLKSGVASPFFGQTHQWEFGKSGIKIKAPGKKSQLSWSQIIEFYVPASGLLIYTSPATFFWLPKSGFSTASDYHKTIDLVRHQLG